MAIEDNEIYGLLGSQIKELPADILKIAAGKAKELTAADYNYPVDNPDCIALWLLEPGFYLKGDDEPVIRYGNGYTTYARAFIVGEEFSNYKCALGMRGAINAGSWNLVYYVMKLNGGIPTELSILDRYFVEDKLTSSDGRHVLSAKQGKVLKDLVDSIAIRGAGAPTTATVGQVGTLYEDTTNGDLYICTDATNPYVWEAVGGGGSITPVQVPGDSTTDVMSQNAVTSMVFADPATQQKIKIGANTSSSGPYQVIIGERANGGSGADNIAIGYGSLGSSDGYNQSVSIGREAKVYRSAWAVALGYESTVIDGVGGVAIGAGSRATQRGQVDFSSVGPNTTGRGYNNSNYRLLTGLYDGQSAHDAATVGQITPTTDSSAPTTATAGRLGEIRIDTTTNTAYMCVLSDSATPAYEWKRITA